MEKECWLCIQQAQYRRDKINKAVDEAKIKAYEQKQTMVVYQEGCFFKSCGVNELPRAAKTIEFVSQY